MRETENASILQPAAALLVSRRGYKRKEQRDGGAKWGFGILLQYLGVLEEECLR